MSVIESFEGTPVHIAPAALLDTIARAFDVSLEDITGRSRQRSVCRVRHSAAYLLRCWFPSVSLQEIGRLLGGRDHTTILYAIEVVPARCAQDPVYRKQIAALLPTPPIPPVIETVLQRVDWHIHRIGELLAVLQTINHPHAEDIAARLAACYATGGSPYTIAAEVLS